MKNQAPFSLSRLCVKLSWEIFRKLLTVVVGSSKGRGPGQAMCAHTAGFEGITTRGERAARIPSEPSLIGLFVPLAVDG